MNESQEGFNKNSIAMFQKLQAYAHQSDFKILKKKIKFSIPQTSDWFLESDQFLNKE